MYSKVCTQKPVLKSVYSTPCMQKFVLTSLYSKVCSCTQQFVLNSLYSNVCTQPCVLRSVCSKVCTQQLVLTSLYSTACTQKYVLTTLYSRAPHPTTSTSLAKFSNRSKPCCQPVKAMLPENRIGSKCQLLEMLTRLLQSYFHVFAGIGEKHLLQTFN